MTAKTIAVLLHQTDTDFRKSNYLLRAVLPLWQRMGLGLKVFRGVRRPVRADVVLPHIDLTVIPEPYRHFAERYAITINRAVVDISKSGISTNLVREQDAYTGPVIVKTDRNYGGMPERRLAQLTRRAGAAARPAARRRRRAAPVGSDWSGVRWMRTDDYPVFPSVADVPATVFQNRDLVVEKFLPEIDGDYYCLRYCYFVGDREVSVLMRSKHSVIKGSKALSCDEVATPPEYRALRERMGFEFGKFDYVLRDGKAVLFDVSRTPSITTLAVHKHMRWIVPHLAEGIRSILDRVP